MQWFGTAYFGWFVSGALFLKSDEACSRWLFVAAVAAGLVSAFTSGLWQPDDILSCLYLTGCVALFAAAQKWVPLQRVLSMRFLLFAGAVSYPLYLLHHEIGIGLISFSGQVLPAPFWPALPALMLALMMLAAWTIARWPETWVNARLKPLVLRSKKGATARAPI